MKRLFHTISLSLMAIAIMILLISCHSKNDRLIPQPDAAQYFKTGTNIPLPDARFQITEQRIARGAYLANGILQCFSCHSNFYKSEPGDSLFEARKGAGVSMMKKTDSLWLYSMNITPDTLTGIGSYSDAEVATAIRKGIGKDGRKLARMPVYDYMQLTNEDLVSVVVYLKTLNPVNKTIPKRKLTQSMEDRIESDPFRQVTDTLLPEPDMNNPLERGKYLVNIGHCLTCHTNWEGRSQFFYAGGLSIGTREGNVYSTNITSDSSGIGSWTKQDFIDVIKTGKSGTLSKVMPWKYFQIMTDEDLGAIYQALKSTPPVKHLVANGVEPTYCEVCHTKHGLGAANTSADIKSVNGLPWEDISGTYKSILNADTVNIDKKGDTFITTIFGNEVKLIPIAENYYSMGMYAPIRFTKTGTEITGFQFDDLSNNFYKKTHKSKSENQ
ncbi:hypothetical protein [Formosa sp. S-31]|uniref:hypothetical protein n=1 Tax=Formosa sp. S-31 TaxID=2790949 RepID=UPI003EB77D86